MMPSASARPPMPTSTGMMRSHNPQSPILGSVPLPKTFYRDKSPVLDHSKINNPCLHTPSCTTNGHEDIAHTGTDSHICGRQHSSTSREKTAQIEGKATWSHQECDLAAHMRQELQKAEDVIERLNAELNMSCFSWIAIQEACPEVSRLVQLPPEDFLKVLEAQRARVSTGPDGYKVLNELGHLGKCNMSGLEHGHLRELSPSNCSSPGSSVAAEKGSSIQEDEDMVDIEQDDHCLQSASVPMETLPETLKMSRKDYQHLHKSRDSLSQPPPPEPSIQTLTHDDKTPSYSQLLKLYQTQCTTLATMRTDIRIVISSEENVRAKNADLRAKNSKLERQVDALVMCRADIEKVIDAEEIQSAENTRLREVNEALKRMVATLESRVAVELGLQ